MPIEPDLPTPNWPSSDRHAPQDYKSLLMHLAAVRLLQERPELVPQLQATLERWLSASDERSRPLFEQWRQILAKEDWATALEDSEAGRQRRQASPLATVLPHETRLGIIAAVRKLKDAGTLRSSGRAR